MRFMPVALALLVAGCSSGTGFSSPGANALVSSIPTVAGTSRRFHVRPDSHALTHSMFLVAHL